MKLTWFGGTTMRVHIGGSILVIDPDGAPEAISSAELTSGADRLLRLNSDLDVVDGQAWRPRASPRPLDADETASVECWSVGSHAIVVDATGEPALLILGEQPPPLGRWVDRAVVVVVGEAGTERAISLLDRGAPRLLALGLEGEDLKRSFAELPGRLDGTGLVALERAMALEV